VKHRSHSELKDKSYSLSSIRHVAKMDVSRYVLVFRYIHITDMFYGTEGVLQILAMNK
jgi:hypothetical protein